jgi:hypothetical protein
MKKALVLMVCIVVLPMVTLADSCLDNSTSQSNFTWNGEAQVFTTICDNGCDSVTGSCNPTPYEANIGTMIVIIIIIVAIGLVYKYARR